MIRIEFSAFKGQNGHIRKTYFNILIVSSVLSLLSENRATSSTVSWRKEWYRVLCNKIMFLILFVWQNSRKNRCVVWFSRKTEVIGKEVYVRFYFQTRQIASTYSETRKRSYEWVRKPYTDIEFVFTVRGNLLNRWKTRPKFSIKRELFFVV